MACCLFPSCRGAVVRASALTLLVSSIVLIAAAPPKSGGTSRDLAPPKSMTPAIMSEILNNVMDLRASTVVTLNVNLTPAVPLTVIVPIDGQPMTLDLLPSSVRAENYQVLVQIADGSLVEAPPTPINTLRGIVAGQPTSIVAASVMDDGFYANILLPDGRKFWVEPVGARIPGAPANQYVIYNQDDVIGGQGVCGMADIKPPIINEQGQNQGGIAGVSDIDCLTELACDADVEYYQAYGSSIPNVQNRINLVINTMNTQYQNQVDIKHVITTIIVRTSEPDPYGSTNPDTLLNQFRNEWLANQGGVQRDVAQLFTGKNLSGTVIGIAWTIGGICTNGAYSLVQSDCCGNLACATDLSAHELGHLWGGFHCTNSCSSTMNSGLMCVNTFFNSNPDSVASIIAHRDSRTCLQCNPANDLCANAETADTGTNPFTTVQSTTDGSSHPACLDGGPSQQIDNDVWFNYTAVCTGTLTATTCSNATFNTKIAVYNGCTCPGTTGNLLGCDDNTAGCTGSTSQVTVPCVSGNCYKIRVGGASGATGTGTLTITCTPGPPANNNCANATPVGNGNTLVNTTSATTDGPTEAACNFNGNNNVQNDVWYRYTATCTGTATFALCGSAFNTKLALYGSSCPAGSGSVLACNDDSCTTNASVTIPVTTNSQYLLRIGGFNGATGNGLLQISCTPGSTPCPADSNDNNGVGAEDLAALLAAWGPCPNPCPPDIAPASPDGTVGPGDLAALLAAWGQCPP